MACSLLRLAGRNVTTAVRGARALSSAAGTGKNCHSVCTLAPERRAEICMHDRRMSRHGAIILPSYCDAVCFYKYGHFEMMLFMYCMQQQQLLTGNLPPQLWGRQP